MDENINWNQMFDNIVQDINVEVDASYENLTSWEIHRAVAGMNETSTYLGRFLLEQVNQPELRLHRKVTPYVRKLIDITNRLSELLAMCECPECAEELDECWCTDDMLCDNCLDDEDEV